MADLIDPAARVYAEALFQAAQDAGRVAQVDADLSGFVGALVSDRPALQALLNPQLPSEAKKRIVASLLRDADPLVRNGMLVLIENGRLSLLHDLSLAFTELAHEEERILDVEVTTAIELGSELTGRLSQRIREATGLQPRLQERVDPGIIGGLVLRARGVLLDASVRRELDEIHRALITTPLPVGSDA